MIGQRMSEEEHELMSLTKQGLSISESSTMKDDEIKMWIHAGIADLNRQGITIKLDNALVKSAIVMYVKSNFGNVDIKEKELSQRTYNLLCNNLSLSSEYKVVDDNA